jgi:hypothetical protein
MIPIQPARGWKTGRFKIVASSNAAKDEWDDFVAKIPKQMKRVYERLSEYPLDVQGTRQFPLKGKRNKPFWEYEVSAGDRLYYAVDLTNQVVVVAVLPHATRSSSMVATAMDRRHAFDGLVLEQETRLAVPPAPVAQPAKRRPGKKSRS